MIFHHYSAMPIHRLDPNYYADSIFDELHLRRSKPVGFWVTDDSETNWHEWCEKNEFRLRHLACRTLVEVDPARLLILDNEADLLEFSLAHSEPYRSASGEFGHFRDFIRWNEIYPHYAGIVISPYQWSCRLSTLTHWYYSWDCASGCIWDLSIVKSLEPDPCYAFSPASFASTSECS